MWLCLCHFLARFEAVACLVAKVTAAASLRLRYRKKSNTEVLLRLPLSQILQFISNGRSEAVPLFFECNKNASLCKQPKPKTSHSSFVCTCNLPYTQSMESQNHFRHLCW
jgi:hypothetical protein